MVTTYCPSGETCDMKPTRMSPVSLPSEVLHSITSLVEIDICGRMGTSVYMPLSFCGPSRSIPSVLPSREKEWQLAHVYMPVRSRRLRDSPTFRRRQLISGSLV